MFANRRYCFCALVLQQRSALNSCYRVFAARPAVPCDGLGLECCVTFPVGTIEPAGQHDGARHRGTSASRARPPSPPEGRATPCSGRARPYPGLGGARRAKVSAVLRAVLDDRVILARPCLPVLLRGGRSSGTAREAYSHICGRSVHSPRSSVGVGG